MDNRTELLNCALRLFASRGYDAVGVQEVVDAAGVTKPTLYHYFGSKQGLLEAVLNEKFAELYAALKTAAVYKGDLPLTLTGVVRAYFAFARENRRFYRMLLAMWFEPTGSDAFMVVSGLNAKQQQLVEQIFLQAVADHGNMRGRHRAYAATFLGTINTYVGLALNGYLELDDELVHRAVHQFMYGIFS